LVDRARKKPVISLALRPENWRDGTLSFRIVRGSITTITQGDKAPPLALLLGTCRRFGRVRSLPKTWLN